MPPGGTLVNRSFVLGSPEMNLETQYQREATEGHMFVSQTQTPNWTTRHPRAPPPLRDTLSLSIVKATEQLPWFFNKIKPSLTIRNVTRSLTTS